MDWAGNLSTQLLRFGNTALINRRRSGKKRLGIGVDRVGEQQLLRSPLHNSSQIHDTQAVADVLDHAQIVCDEQIGEMKFILQIHKNVQDLSLNGHIQSRYRLICYDKFRLDRQRPGYADALTLTAGKLVRIAIRVRRHQTRSNRWLAFSSASALLLHSLWNSIGSVRISMIFCRGFREA